MINYSSEPSEYIPGTPGAGWNDDEVGRNPNLANGRKMCFFRHIFPSDPGGHRAAETLCDHGGEGCSLYTCIFDDYSDDSLDDYHDVNGMIKDNYDYSHSDNFDGQALNWKPHSDGVLGGLKMPKGRGEGWPSENKLMRVRFILDNVLLGLTTHHHPHYRQKLSDLCPSVRP